MKRIAEPKGSQRKKNYRASKKPNKITGKKLYINREREKPLNQMGTFGSELSCCNNKNVFAPFLQMQQN
jgi:hypothetical protein